MSISPKSRISRRTFLKGVMGGAVAVGLAPGLIAFGQPRLRAGFIYLTSPGDAGWTFRHEQGRRFAEQQFAASELGQEFRLETVATENVSDPDAERVARGFAAQRFDVVFATSFGFMDGTLAAAFDFPNVHFEHCSGFKVGANMGNYFGRMYQARYLSGLVAGAMTQRNVLGYVAAIPIPEVIRILNAFYLGAKTVNPEVTMRVVGLGTFFDPPKARESAFALIEAGADVVTMHEDTPAVPQAAEERGVFSVSYQSDMSKFALNSHLTGVFWNWGPYYLQTLETLAQAKLSGARYPIRTVWSGFENKEGFVEPMVGISNEVGGGSSGLINELLIRRLAGASKVREILNLVEKKQKELLNDPFLGNGVIFQGPIRDDQTGEVTIPDGIVPSDLHLLSMDYPVEGVSGPGFFPDRSSALPAFEGIRNTDQVVITFNGRASGIGFLNLTITTVDGSKGFSSGPRGFPPGTPAMDVATAFRQAFTADGTFEVGGETRVITISAMEPLNVSAQSGDGGIRIEVFR
ncbi:MAG: BMP family ABC transporter substrate-binding protein [Candidatus Bipolaricaulia bacterium]